MRSSVTGKGINMEKAAVLHKVLRLSKGSAVKEFNLH